MREPNNDERKKTPPKLLLIIAITINVDEIIMAMPEPRPLNPSSIFVEFAAHVTAKGTKNSIK